LLLAARDLALTITPLKTAEHSDMPNIRLNRIHDLVDIETEQRVTQVPGPFTSVEPSEWWW
jgi:hypothetical protein